MIRRTVSFIGLVMLFGCVCLGQKDDQSQSFNGTRALRACKILVPMFNGEDIHFTEAQYEETRFLTGYVQGWLQGYMTGALAMMDPRERQEAGKTDYIGRGLYCKPPEMSLGQAVRIFAKYLENNPSKLHLDGGGLLGLALRDAYPCHNDK